MISEYTMTQANISAEFPYNDTSLFDVLEHSLKGFTRAEYDDYIKEGYFRYRTIDGEIRYHYNAAKTLLTVCTALHERIRTTEVFDIGLYRQKWRKINDSIEALKSEKNMCYKYRMNTLLEVVDGDETARCLAIDDEDKRWWVHLPFAQSSFVTVLDFEPVSPIFTSPKSLQRTVFFEAEVAQRRFSITYAYEVIKTYMSPERLENHMVVDEAARKLMHQGDTYFEDFLKPQVPHMLFSERLKHIVEQEIKDIKTPLEKAKRLYDYVIHNIRYSFMPDYRLIESLSEFALNEGVGDCGTQAVLWITMLRYAGIPARFTSGRMLSPLDSTTGMHDWVSYYIEPYGWLEADPSFGEEALRLGFTDGAEFYAMNVDPYRVAFNSDFQKPFAINDMPRVDPFDNQCGEVTLIHSGTPFKPNYITRTQHRCIGGNYDISRI